VVEFVTLRTSWQQPAADRLSLRGPKVNSHIRLCRIDDSSVILVSLYLLLLLEFISPGIIIFIITIRVYFAREIQNSEK